MNGAFARRARRRAISVLPTPVGPIMRMFFGVTSARSSAGSCMRRQRLRRAMATARLASSWPMMWRLSSWTISRGVMDIRLLQRGRALQTALSSSSMVRFWLVKTQIEPAMFSAVSATSRALSSALCCSRARAAAWGEAAAGAHGDQAVFGFDHVAVAGDDQRGILVGDREHGFEAAQGAVGAPVLASSTAARTRCPWCFSNCCSKRSNRVKASAVAPAKPAST